MKTILALLLLITTTTASSFEWMKPEIASQFEDTIVLKQATDNSASLVGIVNYESMTILGNFLKEVHATRPIDVEINISLNSPGGSVFAGYNFIEIVRSLQADGRKINGTVNGLCASMCFVILQTLDKRQSTHHSIIMQHNPSGGDDEVLDSIKRLTQKMEASRIGLPIRIWREIVDSDVWFSAEEAKEFKVIDEVVLLKHKRFNKKENSK